MTDVHAKALALNLDRSKYGSFAEIGGGQEVARWFLRVGAASGTVAQTISAYDKTYSDQTYGEGTRYVSRERLRAMLEHEYALLLDRLGPTRGADTCFFAFADTVATRNFRGDNDQHGWMGIRFQAAPGGPPSDVLLHVNLKDPTAPLQQEALGLLGVNLVYAAFHQSDSAADALAGWFDDLSADRLEIDVVELAGPRFAGADARLWSLQALRRAMAHAIVFDGSARVVEPSDLLRRRPLLVERGRVVSAHKFQGDMLRAAARQLRAEGLVLGRDPVSVLEMTIRHAGGALDLDVRHAGGALDLDDTQILERVQQLAPMGAVVVSDFPQTYLLVQYLRRHTLEPIRLVMGVATLAELLQDSYYNQLPGSLLEGLGRLLAENVKLYAYPMPAAVFREIVGDLSAVASPRSGLVSVDDVRPLPPLDHLYRYVRDAGWVVPLAP